MCRRTMVGTREKEEEVGVDFFSLVVKSRTT